MEAVVAEDRGRSEFALTHKAAMAAFVGLSVAFEVVLEAAIFPERVDDDDDGPSARLATLSSNALRKMKNLPTQGISEADEAAGIAAAISVIEGVGGRLRKET
jgi:hypothetical protein